MSDIVLNLILVVFPILIYFIYQCYRNMFMEKYNKLVLDVSLFSSLYLCLKYGNIGEYSVIIVFCNIPIIIAYLKNHYIVAISLSLIVLFYLFNYFSAINLFCYFIIYLLGRWKRIRENTFILSIVVIQGFFSSMYYFSFFSNSELLSIAVILFVILLLYVLPFILLYLFQLADNITSLYLTVSELEKSKQLRDSLFKITHEVKNPIAVCKGYLDMMDISNREQVERYIPIIESEISRSLDIMCDFMEFSKIKIDKEVIDINLLLEEIDKELKLFIRKKNIILDVNLLKEEIYIDGDYSRLKQVFVNLVKNSVESIDGEGKIQIRIYILKGFCNIEIIDNGSGMDEETLVHVKDMFFTTKEKGTGLGVSLSNEIIKAHGGDIDYYSRLGYGTRVVVKIPVVVI